MLIEMLEPNDRGVKNILSQLVPLFLLFFSEHGCLLFPTQTLNTVHKVCVFYKITFLPCAFSLKKTCTPISEKGCGHTFSGLLLPPQRQTSC